MTLKDYRNVAYGTYIYLLRIIKHSLRNIHTFPKEHNIQCLPDISFEEPTPLGATSKTGKCVAVVLWIGGQSWRQSLYVMGPGVLQTKEKNKIVGFFEQHMSGTIIT